LEAGIEVLEFIYVNLNMIRKILTVDSDTISIAVPSRYMGKVLEIIAFSEDESQNREPLKKRSATFNALSLDTKGFKFNRDEANER
jgi:hypothetical protein